MRTDPTETGGLFVGRRPGTAPIRFRGSPAWAGERRRRLDALLAGLLLVSIAFLCLLCWGPIPVLCLWIGSQVQYVSGSVMLGILVAFLAVLGALFGMLMVLTRLDRAWMLVRRAAGHDQRRGVLGRVFAVSAAIGVCGFLLWFLVIHGPGPTVFSGQSGV